MFRVRLAAALAVAALAASPASTPWSPVAALAQMDAARISLADFKKLFDTRQVVVIDTRDAESYRAGHIPGALLVPQTAVAAKLAEVKAAGKTAVTYCT
jgi:predicted sulfurtransferase